LPRKICGRTAERAYPDRCGELQGRLFRGRGGQYAVPRRCGVPLLETDERVRLYIVAVSVLFGCGHRCCGAAGARTSAERDARTDLSFEHLRAEGAVGGRAERLLFHP